MKTAPAGTQVVLRAIRLLKAFTAEEPEWLPAELAARLGLTKTTTHRLLGALESEGLLFRDPSSGVYRLGSAAIALGAQALRSNDLRALVRPHLRELAQVTGETATLEMLVDETILIVDEAYGGRLIAATAEMGTRWPLHATSSGKALLAQMSDAERQSYYEKPMQAYTPSTVTDPAVLETELAAIRERGWASAVEELEAGYVAVGVALANESGALLAAALAVGGPKERLLPRLDEIAGVLRGVVERLGAELGLRPAVA